MSTTTHDFLPADRYVYDFGACSTAKGFAQIDTRQDAWYFGQWCNPFSLTVVCYAEGDHYLDKFDTVPEFAAKLQSLKTFHGGDWKGIDPGFNADLKARFVEIGLGELLH
jgi:hypothetical protein